MPKVLEVSRIHVLVGRSSLIRVEINFFKISEFWVRSAFFLGLQVIERLLVELTFVFDFILRVIIIDVG